MEGFSGDWATSPLSFMDLLDVDERAVDVRLQGIMSRSSFTVENLQRAALLLQYKLLLNSYDHSDADNRAEVEFAIKLITLDVDGATEHICKIVNLALLLNASVIEFKAQHILQQLLSDLDFSSIANINDMDKKTLLFRLKICDSVLDAALSCRIKILWFNETHMENILYSDDTEVRNHFLMKTVVKMVEVVDGMSILDRIWSSVSRCDIIYENKALIAICSLSDFYLPVPNSSGFTRFKSTIIRKEEFWTIVLRGLRSQNSFNRKASLYLAKRAIDCLSIDERDLTINMPDNTDPLLVWKAKEAKTLEESWKCFFLLLETLEEKQGNIVRAALSLFEHISRIGKYWCHCAFELAFKHANLSVVQTCLEFKFLSGVASIIEAKMLLETLNNTNMFDEEKSSKQLIKLMHKSCSDPAQFKFILRSFNDIKWLPVPLFYLTEIFSELALEKCTWDQCNEDEIASILREMMRQPCNNLIIGEAVQCNLIHFTLRNCQIIGITNFINIIACVQCDISKSIQICQDNSWWTIFECEDNSKEEFWKKMSRCRATDIPLIYLRCHPDEINYYLHSLEDRLSRIKDMNTRPYACKDECHLDFTYICSLVKKLKSYDNTFSGAEKIFNTIKNSTECLLVYLMNNEFDIEEFSTYFEHCQSVFSISSPDVTKEVFTKYLPYGLNISHKGFPFADVEQTTKLTSNNIQSGLLLRYVGMKLMNAAADSNALRQTCLEDSNGEVKLGNLRNHTHEIFCELMFNNVASSEHHSVPMKMLIELLNEKLDTGGKGCLLWILRIYKIILPHLCKESKNIEFDLPRFLERVWKEVDELRSNDQFKPNIKEFVLILLHDCLLEREMYHEVIQDYCYKILEYGSVSNVPLYYITDEMLRKGDACDYSFLNTFLSEVLLFGRGSCKHRRITDSAISYIITNGRKFFSVDRNKSNYYYDSEIRNGATKILFKKNSSLFIQKITEEILKKVLAVFQNKTRYHGNSQPHRILLRALQHTLFMSVICPEGVNWDQTVMSYTLLLEKLPHQPSVRIFIEILISLYIIVQKLKFNEETVTALKLNTIPLPSLFTIMYLVMKERIKVDVKLLLEEYTYVLNFLLSHTMGQIFSVRLSAQYFACQLYKISPQEISEKYALIYKIIQQTFEDSKTEKNLIKLQNCYFANKFDVIQNLTPKCIYYFIPKYFNVDCDEIVEHSQIPSIDHCIQYINQSTKGNIDLCQVWLKANKRENSLEELLHISPEVKTEILVQDVSTIQKKYVPWSNMFHGEEACMVNAHRKSQESGLIVVASLIDKLPNLGGLARTSEVFGVQKYIIDNLQHAQDKQFQGLSVSAEKWVPMEQVKPGQQLKEYLEKMKRAGYTVVAAEQTSSSVSLDGFTFPHNTVLLLGHEKEGVPCDLLPLADRCVEIPQRGLVRSLNVHVTAAIFIWEYVRQNLLK